MGFAGLVGVGLIAIRHRCLVAIKLTRAELEALMGLLAAS